MNKRHRRLRWRKMLGVSFMIGVIGWAAVIEVGLPSPLSAVSQLAEIYPG